MREVGVQPFLKWKGIFVAIQSRVRLCTVFYLTARQSGYELINVTYAKNRTQVVAVASVIIFFKVLVGQPEPQSVHLCK